MIANAEKDGEEDSYELQLFKCLAMKNLELPYDIEILKALIEKEESGNPSIEEIFGAAQKGEQRRSLLSFGLAKEKLGWEPKVSIEEGLKLTYRWFSKVKV